MTHFYFKLVAGWFILGIETLNETNLSFQTQRSALEITSALSRVPNQRRAPEPATQLMLSDDHNELIIWDRMSSPSAAQRSECL